VSVFDVDLNKSFMSQDSKCAHCLSRNLGIFRIGRLTLLQEYGGGYLCKPL